MKQNPTARLGEAVGFAKRFKSIIMKKKIFTYVGLALLFLFVLGMEPAFAQTPPPPPPPPPNVPIGGLLIAVFFGVGAYFGVRRLKK